MKTDLTEKDALRAYARMMETLSVESLAWKMTKDFHYTSAWVSDEIISRDEYLVYIRPKLKTIKASGSRIWARMGYWGDRPCLTLAQGSKDNHVSTVFAEVRDGKVAGISLCCVPVPNEVEFR